MTKKQDAQKQDFLEVSGKSTKDQILAAYNDVLIKLNDKHVTTPQEQKKQEAKQEVVAKAANNSSDDILTDLSSLKSKTIKQIDVLSEQLLNEFQKLANVREAIILEQKHLQELYQINETANSLSALLQSQIEQKSRFEIEMDKVKKEFQEEMASQKLHWQQQRMVLEQEYKEQKETLAKNRKREEEEYIYTLELTRRKETDEYNNKKLVAEKELSDLKTELLRQEADLAAKAQDYNFLKMQVDQIPSQINEAVASSEELLRNQLLQQYDFEKQFQQKEYTGILGLKEQSISYLEERIIKQEATIKELTEKADHATQQVQSIACRALDTSGQRFVSVGPNKTEERS